MSKQLKNCKNIKQHGRGRNISDRHLSAGEEPAAKHSLLAAGVEFILWVSCALGTPTDATMLWLGNRSANYSAKYSRFVCRTRQPEVTRRQPSCPMNCWIPQPSLPRLPKNFSIVLLRCSGVVSLLIKMFYAAQTQGITHIKGFSCPVWSHRNDCVLGFSQITLLQWSFLSVPHTLRPACPKGKKWKWFFLLPTLGWNPPKGATGVR